LKREGWVDSVKNWAENVIQAQGYLIAEPLLNRLMDFSAQYEMSSTGQVKLLGMTRMLNDKAGRFLGTVVQTKWVSGVDEKLSQWLFRDAKVMQVYRYDLPEVLEKMLANYAPLSAFGVDAMVYQGENGEFHLRKVVELNARFTMGRVALELLKQYGAHTGFYQILRKSKMDSPLENWLKQVNEGIENPSVQHGSVVLNDPSIASEFYAIWHARKSANELDSLIALVMDRE